jgi:hypothetical protein
MSNAPPHDPLQVGLLNFYSSQAQVVLDQYDNINQLLGPTHEWTHPGTLCEVLIRTFLQRNLLAWMQVDKGYIFGRSPRRGEERHSPEVDILIHDCQHFRPIFRLDDFVIIQPDATLGIIQVKRSLDSDQCVKAISNVVESKWHVVHCSRTHDTMYFNAMFSAVVAFEHPMSRNAEFGELLKKYIVAALREFPPTPMRNDPHLYVLTLPHFIGSLKGCFAVLDDSFVGSARYAIFESEVDKRNVALQALLLGFIKAHWKTFYGVRQPPFSLPRNMVQQAYVVIDLPGERAT